MLTADLVEDGREVLPDRAGRDRGHPRDLAGGAALEHQRGHHLLAVGQAVGSHQQWGQVGGPGRLDDHRHPTVRIAVQAGAVQDEPLPGLGTDPGPRRPAPAAEAATAH
jgi:hypothetical protein